MGGGLTAKQRAHRERVRFAAAEMFAQGVAPSQVARRLRITRKSAYAWHQRWQAGGIEALRSKGPSSRPSRMPPTWVAWLDAALQQGPAAHGWTEDQRWTLARVATVIARRFHVRFSLAHVDRILHQMGYSVQVAAHRAAERDPEVLPAYAPDLNPTEGVGAHPRASLVNLAPHDTDHLAALIRARLKTMRYRPELLDGFLAGTGLILAPPSRSPEARTSQAPPERQR